MNWSLGGANNLSHLSLSVIRTENDQDLVICELVSS